LEIKEEKNMNIIEYVTNNWATIIQLYLAVVGLASIIVKLTPTKKDDAILTKVINFVSKFIALNKDK